MWSAWLGAASQFAYATRSSGACGVVSGERLTDAAAACVSRAVPGVRFLAPVQRKATPRHDGCECTTLGSCFSGIVDVRPLCGCEDFGADGYVFCYVQGACAGAYDSHAFTGAAYRTCVGPPPPPPHALACADPLFPQQWHLPRASVPLAWGTTKGHGATVAIFDDGVQYAHPDLLVDRGASFGWDLQTGARLATANSDEALHGTASAGVAAAVADNGRGGCGVAPQARLVAVRLLGATVVSSDTFVADDVFAESLRAFEHSDAVVVSNSWGPPDDGRVDGPGIRAWYRRVDEALADYAARSRSGVVLFASGNGGKFDNANDDGFASHWTTIAVGAVGDDGQRTPYSEPGACIDVVAPSDGGWRAVTTTDLVGAGGYGLGNATDAFGGTSAATPLVAGVAALVLAARADLASRDVRRILHVSAKVTDAAHEGWVVNAAGRSFNPWYGFGLVHARDAVQIAATWVPLPASAARCGDAWNGFLPLRSDAWTRVPLDAGASFVDVDEARVHVDVTHPFRGDVLLRLVSPAGTTSVLTFEVPDTIPLRDLEFVPHDYATLAFEGEYAAKAGWFLELRDVTQRGRLRRAQLCARGALGEVPPSPPAAPPVGAAAAGSGNGWLRVVLWALAALAWALCALVRWRYAPARSGRVAASTRTEAKSAT